MSHSYFITVTTTKLSTLPACILTRTSCTTAFHTFAGTFHCSLQASEATRVAFSVLCPTMSFWSWCLLLSQITGGPDSSLICNTFAVLQQCILRWFHCSVLLTEQLPSCLIDKFVIACLVILNDSEAFQKLEVLGLHSNLNVGMTCHVEECLGHLRVTFPWPPMLTSSPSPKMLRSYHNQ